VTLIDNVSVISEIAIGYALLTVGQNRDESKIMRLHCADAARELGQAMVASEIEKSITGTATTLVEAVESYGLHSVKAS
jgi:hypothetical protein